jgi:NMD protein affecting ribosome stability and mRNA decay
MHCPECGARENLTFYRGRHLCPACLMRIEKVQAIPKNMTPTMIREMTRNLEEVSSRIDNRK